MCIQSENYGDFRRICNPRHNYVHFTGGKLRHGDSPHFLWGKHLQCGVVDTFKHKDVVLKYVIILQESYSSRAVYVASRLEIAFIGTPNIEQQQQQNCHSKEVDDTSCMKKTDNFLL